MDAVCFDMDGVVVDSERHWIPLENDHIFPAAVDAAVEAEEISGMNVEDLYDHLDAEYGTTIGPEEFVGMYDDTAEELYTERADLMLGFPDLVEWLEDNGVATALVSSSPHRWIDLVLERFDLAFDAVVSAEDVDGHGKPAPDIYRLAADRLGVAPSRCVAVEDSTAGATAATRAGMYCLGYRESHRTEADLSPADALVTGPEALREHLEVLCARPEFEHE